MTAFRLLVLRDLRLALRQGGDAAMGVAFFVLTVILFPFGVGPEAELLARIAAGLLWVTALLAALFALERLVHAGWGGGGLAALGLMAPPVVGPGVRGAATSGGAGGGSGRCAGADAHRRGGGAAPGGGIGFLQRWIESLRPSRRPLTRPPREEACFFVP